MRIEIKERLRPFSHLPGTVCLIPGSHYVVRAYPTQLQILDLSLNVVKEEALPVRGPLKEFTVIQDLEKECVTICSEEYRCHVLSNLEIVYGKKPKVSSPCTRERLSFGCHKKQEIEGIKKRGLLSEIFPFLYRLGSLYENDAEKRGEFSLLDACQNAIDMQRPEKILEPFDHLFRASFHGLFVPRLEDDQKQGIVLDLFRNPISAKIGAFSSDSLICKSSTPSGYADLQIRESEEKSPNFVSKANFERGLFEKANGSPLWLLSRAAQMIRSLFFISEGATLSILPNLPPELHAGRFTSISPLPGCILDIEWTKKTIRKVKIYAHTTTSIQLRFQPFLKEYRLRNREGEKGNRVQCGEELELKAGKLYLLDQFQK